MKTKFLIIIGMFVFSLVIPQGFSQCIYNEDWYDAPCFDTGPVSHFEFYMAWGPYYDHKGSEWMETKRIELHQAIEQGSIEEWVKKIENHNVYQYYLSTNEIQSHLSYDQYVVELDPNFLTSGGFIVETRHDYILIIIISIVFSGVTALFYFKKRK